MAIAQRDGGLYVVNGVVVDAHGAIVSDPPTIGPDTVPAPAGAVVPIATQIAEGVAKAMASFVKTAPAADDSEPAASESFSKAKK